MNDHTNLEQSKRLATLGYEGAFPQMAWMRHKMEPVCELVWLAYPPAGPSAPLWEWYPAPTLLRVLDWLQEEKGWQWRKVTGGYCAFKMYGEVARWLAADPLQLTGFDTPSDLIDAILDKVEEDASHD